MSKILYRTFTEVTGLLCYRKHSYSISFMNVLRLLTTKNTGKLRICFSQKFLFSQRQGGVEKSNWPDCQETDFWLSKVLQPQVSHSFLSSSDLTCHFHSQLPSSLTFRCITHPVNHQPERCALLRICCTQCWGRVNSIPTLYLHRPPEAPFPPTSPQWWFSASTWNISTLFSNICPYTPLLTQCRGQSLLTHSKHGRCQCSVTFPWATNKESPPALHPPFPVSFHTQVLLLVSQVNPELSYTSYSSDTLRTTHYPSVLLLYRVPPVSICICSKHAQAFI